MASSTTDWRLIGLLYLAGLLAAAQFAKIALYLDELGRAFPDMPVPLLVSAVSIAGILFGVTAGVLAARLGPRRVLLTALATAAILTIGQATTPSFPVFVALRVFEGAAHLAIVVSAPTLMAASAKGRDIPVAMGLWGTFFGVGFALTAAVVPMLPDVKSMLMANAGAFFVLAVALAPLLPKGLGRHDVSTGFWRRHIDIYTSPRLVAPAVGFFAHTLVFLGLLTFLPDVLGAWSAPVLPLVALVGTFGAGVLARRISPQSIKLVAFALSLAGLLATLALPEHLRVLLLVPLMMVIGLVPGAAFARVPALNSDPADQARANGAIAQLGNVGTATSVPLFAIAIEAGFAGLALTTAAISALGLASVWLIHRKIV